MALLSARQEFVLEYEMLSFLFLPLFHSPSFCCSFFHTVNMMILLSSLIQRSRLNKVTFFCFPNTPAIAFYCISVWPPAYCPELKIRIGACSLTAGDTRHMYQLVLTWPEHRVLCQEYSTTIFMKQTPTSLYLKAHSIFWYYIIFFAAYSLCSELITSSIM